jgi:hypothetical protein
MSGSVVVTDEMLKAAKIERDISILSDKSMNDQFKAVYLAMRALEPALSPSPAGEAVRIEQERDIFAGALQQIINAPCTSDSVVAFRLKMIAVDAFTNRLPLSPAHPVEANEQRESDIRPESHGCESKDERERHSDSHPIAPSREAVADEPFWFSVYRVGNDPIAAAEALIAETIAADNKHGASADAMAGAVVANDLLAALRSQPEAVQAIRCPCCADDGYYVQPNLNTGDPEQVQCEFCYTTPNSVFNIRQRTSEAVQAWAVVGPDGEIHLNTIAEHDEGAWSKRYGGYVNPKDVEIDRSTGYRCAQVTITPAAEGSAK